ncbi:hypothetical protein ACG92W_01105 [Acinetobacter ursingii]|uniref:hypothetical protein n=1 Tax=Acinetobacter TaxID=469 RepID=UPI0012503F2B|nr:hypothetical protein [Acinetobacter seifertii]
MKNEYWVEQYQFAQFFGVFVLMSLYNVCGDGDRQNKACDLLLCFQITGLQTGFYLTILCCCSGAVYNFKNP